MRGRVRFAKRTVPYKGQQQHISGVKSALDMTVQTLPLVIFSFVGGRHDSGSPSSRTSVKKELDERLTAFFDKYADPKYDL
ncbi:hypothetical protein CEE35_01995 [Candidatus Aerophobetes bacterium Ae_b3b]|nr:MAG: hypothetical protein CEE35_01995 [Candidatus Aerophobetes bacterium Ae_b3b]